MKTMFKKVAAIFLAVGVAAGALSGCASKSGEIAGDGEKGGDSSGGQAMGRYLEEEVSLPEGMAEALAMAKLQDGKVRILGGMQEGKYCLWDSPDHGTSWEKAAELKNTEEEEWVMSAALSSAGEGFLIAYGSMDESRYYHMLADGELKEVKMDLGQIRTDGETSVASGVAASAEVKEGEADIEADTQEPGDAEERAGESASDRETPEDQGMVMDFADMENSLNIVRFGAGDRLFANDFNQRLYQIDAKTGEIQREISSETAAFAVAGNLLLTDDGTGSVVLYDADSAKLASQDSVLLEALKEEGGIVSNVGGVETVIFAGSDEADSFYYCNRKGLYRHVAGGTVNEQIIDGNLNSLGSPQTGLVSMVEWEDGEFLVLGNMADAQGKLFRYTYSPDTPSRPSRELKLYALRDHEEIRQIIAMFQKEHADCYVDFQVGMSGENQAVLSDVLKALNADIMAGKGPDVLILDGMPIQSYSEKGLLADLTAFVEELKAGEGCFEKIAETYRADGKICALPTRFKIPVVIGDEDIRKASLDLTAFADRIEEMRKADPEVEGIIESSSPDILVEKLYQSYSPAFLKEDGTLSAECVEEFYTQAKRIYDTGKYDREKREAVSYTVSAYGMDEAFTGIGISSLNFLGGEMKANIGMLGTADEFNQMQAGNQKLNLVYDLLCLAKKKVYAPSVILGVSSKSGRMEEAAEFVRYALKEETQKINQGGGFPVNRAAYEASTIRAIDRDAVSAFTTSDMKTGKMLTLDVRWADEEAYQELQEKIESLDTPVLMDDVIKEALTEQAVKCLNEECGIEDAVQTLMRKVNLYLAE